MKCINKLIMKNCYAEKCETIKNEMKMAYAGSNDAKMKFVGGAVFAKFGLFWPQNCIFAANFKSIVDRGLILVAIIP